MANDGFGGLIDATRSASASFFDYLGGFTSPTVRLGVTGLSRAGKTVFITALVHALIAGGRLPVFRAQAEGRIRTARIAEQPDPDISRFAYEDYIATLTGPGRSWPDSTRQISEIRVDLAFERPAGWLSGGRGSLSVDIIDYPGEWLLDLPLLDKDYSRWSRETLQQARVGGRQVPFAPFLARIGETSPAAPAEEMAAKDLARLFTDALLACRDERIGLSSLPPGRFLMPGELEGSPALTFAPLALDGDIRDGSLAAMMQRRYEAYKERIVSRFFREHFARLDRQIVLVDVLSALNAGGEAMRDLELALADVLSAFNVGQNSLLSSMFAPRIDRVLFAATKADHLHHTNHDRLEGALKLLTRRALARAKGSGSTLDVLALAAIRATREVEVRRGRDVLQCIAGVPARGERLGDEIFDGEREVALFPGDLPADPAQLFVEGAGGADLRFLRFRPPITQFTGAEHMASLPHIRLDHALQFLIGDKLA